MRGYSVLAAGAMAVLLSGQALCQEIIVGGFPSSMPYSLTVRDEGQPDRVTGGIIKDIADELSRRTGLSFRFVFLPRKRMEAEIASGGLDIIAIGNPAWVRDPETLLWSAAVFEERMFFLTLRSFGLAIDGPARLSGLTIGMRDGYVFPELDGVSGYLRDDAVTMARNIARLQAGWIDAVYGSELDSLYQAKEAGIQYTVHPWSPASSEYHWAVSRRLGETAELIVRTLDAMIKDGTIEKILAAYR